MTWRKTYIYIYIFYFIFGELFRKFLLRKWDTGLRVNVFWEDITQGRSALRHTLPDTAGKQRESQDIIRDLYIIGFVYA